MNLQRDGSTRTFLQRIRAILCYLFILLLFFVTSARFAPHILLPLHFVTGFVSVLLIPGDVFGQILLGSQRPMGFTFVLGLAWNVLLIHFGFILAVFVGLFVHMSLWLTLWNALLIVSAMPLSKFDEVMSVSRWKKKLTIGRPLLIISVFGLIARAAMLWVGFEALAPDAGLYFDYARSINAGFFNSSICNDGAVMLRTPVVDEIAHQSTAYVYALSYALFPTDAINPVIILPIMGMLVVYGGYSITHTLFGQRAAWFAAALLVFHPTLVYFSAMGYGPEIFSLVFVLFSALLLLRYGTKPVPLFLMGVFVVLAESIWHVSFYMVVFIFPIALVIKRGGIDTETTLISLGLFATILARHLVANFLAFSTIWVGVFLSIAVLDTFANDVKWKRILPYFLGTFLALIVFYLPSQVLMMLSGVVVRSIALDALATSMIRFPNLLYLLGGSLFLIWHITIPILALSLGGLYFFRRNTDYQMILVMIIAALGGHAIALYSIEPVQVQYLYTTARFLQGIIVMFSILAGASLEVIYKRIPAISMPGRPTNKQLGKAIIVILIFAGSFAPGYVLGTYHSKYVTPRTRFGWQGLEEWTPENSADSDIFLLERAREFAWMMDRQTVQLKISSTTEYEWQANLQMLELAQDYSADYFVLDSYTLQKWDHFSFLLRDNLSMQSPILLNASLAAEHSNDSVLSDAPSMRLVKQTEGNAYGDYVRIFEYVLTNYVVVWESDSLLDRWDSLNGSLLVDGKNGPQVMFHDQSDGEFSLSENLVDPIEVSGGFLVLSLEKHDAAIKGISILNQDGEIINHVEEISEGTYYCILEDGYVTGVVIEISGQPDGYITLNGLEIWQEETSH